VETPAVTGEVGESLGEKPPGRVLECACACTAAVVRDALHDVEHDRVDLPDDQSVFESAAIKGVVSAWPA